MMETMLLQQSSAAAGNGMDGGPGAVAAAKQERDADDDGDEQEAEAEAEEEQRRQRQAGADQEAELRRGPWTVDEDLTLINYISDHGEGRWNALARAAGLMRTGKSCRLRWLNYLRPDVKRGDITADEQLLILDLHSRWGNRWSKIAAQLPGRTDNEIKNYWRTRVQKHAKQLNCDVNSKRFKDAMRFLWMPRLAERANAANNAQQQHHPSPSPLTTTPCMSSMATPAALMTTMQLVDAPSNSNSNNSSSPSSAVTTAACSSSCSSLTSDTAHDIAAAEPPVSLTTAAADDDDYYWGAAATATPMQQQQLQNDDHYDFWSTASALQHLTAGEGDNHGFQQHQHAPAAADHDLTGWVQGFSDGICCLSGSSSASDNLWSLDDIWRVPPPPQGYYT